MTTELTTRTLTAESSHHPLLPPDTFKDDPSQKPYRSSSKQRPFENGNNSNSNSNSKRKPQTKNRKKKQPYKPAYLDTIQQEIDDLKKELMVSNIVIFI
jgi:hypothetical protein